MQHENQGFVASRAVTFGDVVGQVIIFHWFIGCSKEVEEGNIESW